MPSGGWFPFGGTARDSAVPRLTRGVGAGVWLVYIVLPLRAAIGHGHSLPYTAGLIALAAAFAVIYLAAIVLWVPALNGVPALTGPRRLNEIAFGALFALALTATVTYGAPGITMWIFVSSAAAWLIRDQRQALRMLAVTTACYLVLGITSHLDTRDYLLNLLPIVLVGTLVIGLRRRLALARELTEARDEIERMAAAAERLRLARDLHDLTGQSLSTITLKSELAARLLGTADPAGPDRDRDRDRDRARDRAREEIEQVAEVSRQTLRDIRQAISGYRRPTLAVEIITARSALDAAGIRPHDDAELTLASGTFDPDAEAALAWCLREAVTNVIRHSGARNCHINLTRRADTVSLTVRDDGHGCEPYEWPVDTPITVSMGHPSGAGAGAASGAGLRGMSERVTAVGGHLELRPSADGFALTATVPAGDRVTVTS